ncbi:hypothetical protein LMG26857_03506 [Achromobacter anxifer]|nr:hypothetical protein LMG26857_03506 [Achromobacter anxifer]
MIWAPTVGAIFRMEWFQTILLALILAGLARTATAIVHLRTTADNRRFWALTFRNAATAAFVLGLGIIWIKELQAVLVALGAAAAGFLIGFKEQWQSLLAFWIRVIKRHYSLNDIIEVEGVRGRVLDITWLTTSLAEIGAGKDELAYSGRIVHVPNSRMIMANLTVENITGAYAIHTFEVPLPKHAQALRAEQLLGEIATRHCQHLFAAAETHMRTQQRDHGLDAPDVKPRTRLHIESEGRVVVLVRIVVPVKEKARIEQAIIHELLEKADAKAWPMRDLK